MPTPEAPFLPGARTPAAWRPRRRIAVGSAIVGGAVLSLGGLALLLWAFVALSWTHRGTPGHPEFGINFSCSQAEYLLLETPGGPFIDDNRPRRAEWCANVLHTILAETGARHVRLSVEWSDVEPADGRFDFALLDALLEAASKDGARVLLSVGMKAQRHPEYYIPGWLLERLDLEDGADVAQDPLLRARALSMVSAVAGHAAASNAVVGWLAENEPYHRSPRAHDWYLGRDYVREVVAAIHAADPLDRPVAINHAERLAFDRRWKWGLEDGDAVATSIYPFRNNELLGRKFVLDILNIGPLMPNYRARAAETRERGKPYWITELQAEPWSNPDVRLISPSNPARDLTPEHFRRNVHYGRLTGADRVYLWGAEWWLLQRDRHGDSTWFAIAREAIAGGDATARTQPGARP